MTSNTDTREEAQLRARARALTEDIAPAGDLWPGIEAHLDAAPARTGWSRVRLGAAAAVLVTLTSAATLWLSGTGSPLPAASQSTQMLVAATPRQLMLGPEFAQSRTDLILSLERELEALSPEDREILLSNVVDIDAAVDEIRTALADNPNSELLLHLLLSAYTDQLAMLSRIDGMTRSMNEGTQL